MSYEINYESSKETLSLVILIASIVFNDSFVVKKKKKHLWAFLMKYEKHGEH